MWISCVVFTSLSPKKCTLRYVSISLTTFARQFSLSKKIYISLIDCIPILLQVKLFSRLAGSTTEHELAVADVVHVSVEHGPKDLRVDVVRKGVLVVVRCHHQLSDEVCCAVMATFVEL